jgi:hypothetical protein
MRLISSCETTAGSTPAGDVRMSCCAEIGASGTACALPASAAQPAITPTVRPKKYRRSMTSFLSRIVSRIVMLEEVLQLEDECSLNPAFRRSSELNLHQDERRSCGARAFDKEQRYVSIICAGYVMSLPMLAIPDAHPPAIGDGAANSHVRAENDQPEMRLFSVRHAIVT